jgi:hypothetical protein
MPIVLNSRSSGIILLKTKLCFPQFNIYQKRIIDCELANIINIRFSGHFWCGPLFTVPSCAHGRATPCQL